MTPKRVSGFTLIELLVALLIFGIFSTLAYAGLGRLLDSQGRLSGEQRLWQDVSQAFLRLSDDLAHARARPVRDVSGFELPAFIGRPYDSRPLADPSLELTRGGELNYGGAAQSDLRRVAYQLKEGRLMRITWPVLDRAPVTLPRETLLLGEVEEFELRFDGGSGSPGSSVWPAAGGLAGSLPLAVEVTLGVKGVGRIKRQFLVNR